MPAVYVMTTGGTIEKVYSERNGALENLDNKIDRYLRQLRLPETEVNVVPLMNKDSLEMTDQDRALILGMVRAVLKETHRLSSPTVPIRSSKRVYISGGRCPNWRCPLF